MKTQLYCCALPFLMLTATAGAQHRDDRGGRREPDYRTVRRAGSSISIYASLPHGAIEVVLGRDRYHYSGGRYYRPYDRGYVLVAPPRGIIIPSLPPGVTIVITGGRRYYYYEDVYYLPADRGYEVVARPEEVVTTAPATNYEKVIIEGRTYYKRGDSYYKAVIDDKGEIFYEKAGAAS
jgi:hypothetical protein